MIHIWTKSASAPRTKRPVVAVIDDDDGFRRAALRCVRRLDLTGVGLIDTGAAMRWIATTKPAVVMIAHDRVSDVARACAALARDERPRVIATVVDRGPVAGALATVAKPLDDRALVEALDQVLARRDAPEPSGTEQRKKRVLLVDDDDDIRETFSILLEEEGYEVVPAPHGKAAWNALQGGLRPDVILLDLMMPVMSGHEVFARLKGSALAALPVVVITAGTDVLAGAAPVLRKPVDMHALLSAVSRAAA